MSVDIPSPEEFFGHRMGADRKLARWDRIVEYYHLLERSQCVRVTELGRSSEGNPFILVQISSPENIENSEKIRMTSLRLAQFKALSEADVSEILAEGKTVVAIGLSMHASEVGGTQMGPELAYELATQPDLDSIRNNTMLLLIPCLNPDGQIMVTDWYNQHLGTEYEGVGLPWLYHKYTGHDNNRDAFYLQMPESQMLARILYTEWRPQAYADMHHMGSYGARYYIPPLGNPLSTEVDPLVWVEQGLYGAMMAVALEQAGKSGFESGATYSGEVFPGFDYTPCWHGTCAMLTESASARIASPIYIHRQQLAGSRRGRPEDRTQLGFPHPWIGGWWRLRDIVEQQKISAIALLQTAATHREMILRNMRLKAARSYSAGSAEPPFAFVMNSHQHDPLTLDKFLRMLLRSGVKIHRSLDGFSVGNQSFPQGSYVVFTDQISRPYLLTILRETRYYDGPFARDSSGIPLRPEDSATNSIHELMGVSVIEAMQPLIGQFEEVSEIPLPVASVEANCAGYLLDGRANYSYLAVNRLLDRGLVVQRLSQSVTMSGQSAKPSSFFIPSQEGAAAALADLAVELGLRFAAPSTGSLPATTDVRKLRTGVYQRYYGGNMDEGWTRWLLEKYGFEYKSLKDAEIRGGGLQDKYDVIVLPSDDKVFIMGDGLEEHFRSMGREVPKYPPDYRSGIGKDGVAKLREFVEAGGRLVALDEASVFAIEELRLPVSNALSRLGPKEFWCPGSTLMVDVDYSHALASGVGQDVLIYFRSHIAFEIKPTARNEDVRVIVSYPDSPRRLLRSGWLIGDKYLRRKAALLELKLGKGNVILFGFPPQYRAQTDATFKFLFNCLLG